MQIPRGIVNPTPSDAQSGVAQRVLTHPPLPQSERLLLRDACGRSGSFTPIRTKAPAGGSTAYS